MKRSDSVRALTLVDVLVSLAITAIVLAVVFSMLLSQRGRVAPPRTHCKNNLKQLGLALHNYHDAWNCFPPGLVDDDDDPREAIHTGLLLLLPFIEETALYNGHNFAIEARRATGGGIAPDAVGTRRASSRGWERAANSTVVTKQLNQFFCPTNRAEGTIGLDSPDRIAGATDYAFASGAIPLLCTDRTSRSDIALLRGMFGPNSDVKIRDVHDGLALTIAMTEVSGGEHIGGTIDSESRNPADADSLAVTQSPTSPHGIDQGWAVARINGDRATGPRGSILTAAFQHVGHDLQVNDTVDELPARINPRWVTVSRIGPRPDHPDCGSHRDRLSQVRSLHEGGAHFLMGDGTVRFVSENVNLKIYGGVFTISGSEIVNEDDF